MRIHSSQHARAGARHPTAAPFPGGGANDGNDRIGDLLIAGGVLTPAQVEHVSRAQRASGQRFGETAVGLGFAGQEAVDRALARQFDFSVTSSGESRLHPSLVTARGEQGRSSELIRSLRAKLWHELSTRGDGPYAVSVVSVTGQVGRRLIAANLAIAFGQANIRTVIVDADLRGASLHRLFDAPNDTGLSTFLARRQAQPTLIPIAEIPNLAFHPAGPLPPNPAELLVRLPEALEAIRRAWDAGIVILNTPPLDTADDAYLVGTAAPAALMVVRRCFTRSRPLAAAGRRFAAAGIPVIGSVLNVA